MCPFTPSVETNLALCLSRDPNCQLGIVCVHTHTHTQHTHTAHTHACTHTHSLAQGHTKEKFKHETEEGWRKIWQLWRNVLEPNSRCDLVAFSEHREQGAEKQTVTFQTLIAISFISFATITSMREKARRDKAVTRLFNLSASTVSHCSTFCVVL